MGTLKVVEIMGVLNERSSAGRVVINPPKSMAPLKSRAIAEIKICCGRAYLTEESFNRHRLERTKEHLNDLWNDRLIEEEDPNAEQAKATSSKTVTLEKPKLESISKKMKNSGKKVRIRKGDVRKCNLCGILTSSVNYGRHLKQSHDPASKFKCKWCTCKFPTKRSAMSHSARIHPIEHKKFCWKAATQNKHVISARKMTSVVDAMSSPKKTPNGAEPDSNTEDVPEQESLQAVNQVFSIKKRKKVHECIFCGKILKNKISFQHHLLIHTGDRPYKCKVCDSSFRHTGNLSRHYKTVHSYELKFQCALCPSRFYTQATLLEHMRRKHKESFVPNTSILTTPNRSPLRRKKRVTNKQMQNMEPIKVDDGYQCSICGKVLKHLLTFRGHRLIHANSFPHKCSKCNAKFRLISTLERHVETNHVENGSYTCTLCTCAFNSPRGLNRHMQCYHSGKRKRNSFGAKEKVAKVEVSLSVERSVSPDISTLGTSPSARRSFARKLRDTVQSKSPTTSKTKGKRGNTSKTKILEETSEESQPKKKTQAMTNGACERVAMSIKNKVVEQLSQQEPEPEPPTTLKISGRQSVAKTSSVKTVEPDTKKKTRKRKRSRLTVQAKKGKTVVKHEVKRAKIESEESTEVTMKSKSPEKGNSKPPCTSPSKEKLLSPKRILLKIPKRKLSTHEHVETEPELKRRRRRQKPKEMSALNAPLTVEDKVVITEEAVVEEKKTRKRRSNKDTDPPDLQCKICSKTFASPQSKRLHETLHTGAMQYSCDYCNQQFRLFSSFDFHIKRFENPRGNFLCALCISRCGSEEALNHHMAIHKYKRRNYSKSSM